MAHLKKVRQIRTYHYVPTDRNYPLAEIVVDWSGRLIKGTQPIIQKN